VEENEMIVYIVLAVGLLSCMSAAIVYHESGGNIKQTAASIFAVPLIVAMEYGIVQIANLISK
jgi:hypothetical protein